MSDAPSIWSLQRNDAVWARRAHPVAFWMRLAVLPLLAATLWLRPAFDPGFLLILLVLLFMPWLGDRLFPGPGSATSWPVRAALGERLIAEHRTLPMGVSNGLLRTLVVVGAVGTVIMVSGAILFDASLAVGGLVLTLGAKLVFFDRVGRAWRAAADGDAEVASWARSH